MGDNGGQSNTKPSHANSDPGFPRTKAKFPIAYLFLFVIFVSLVFSIAPYRQLHEAPPLHNLSIPSSLVAIIGLLSCAFAGMLLSAGVNRAISGSRFDRAFCFICLLFEFALLSGQLAWALIGSISVVVIFAEEIYEKFVVGTLIDDIGVVAPIILLVFLIPIPNAHISAASLSSLYSSILQAALVFVGLVFTFVLFLADRASGKSASPLLSGLGGFLRLFIALSVLSAIGLIGTTGDIEISNKNLYSYDQLMTANSAQVIIFFLISGVFVTSLAYIIVIFRLLLLGIPSTFATERGRDTENQEAAGKPVITDNAAKIGPSSPTSKTFDSISETGLGWPEDRHRP